MISQCGKKHEEGTELIPLPEHPRPDFERSQWVNLNGRWDFSLDSLNTGESNGWYRSDTVFEDSITVPFSWASPFSGVGRKDVHIGWYTRNIEIPSDWNSKRVFLVIGASDCVTTAWLNGKSPGSHEGGYTPFEFELTEFLKQPGPNRLVLRVEDDPTRGRLVGKQVYGEAKGIWQTVYLEARSSVYITKSHFLPDIDRKLATLKLTISEPADDECSVNVSFRDEKLGEDKVSYAVPSGRRNISFDIPIKNMRLWTLEDPFLYKVNIRLEINKSGIDSIHTYFGMRKIGMDRLPGSQDMYVTLNDRPVYLRMALDQSYHPDGYYTFPTDNFMRGEIERAKAIGLNGLRIHIKSEIPRKLYWADRLGLLIMADIPNIGGEPDDYGRKNWEYTAFRQIERDFNHPSIFSWVLFNETWGLNSRKKTEQGKIIGGYWPETQEWVKSLYQRIKDIDPTRLVEDNSPSQGGRYHVETDINSWHAYLASHKWTAYTDMVLKNTFSGSPWNYIEPYVQTDIPMMNSECGAVWGYQNGTGDVDLGYEYHIMINEFRRRPKICGFIFTEFHDVINEWNGYYRFDRSLKDYGLDELCPDMTVKDFHSDLYLVVGDDFRKTVKPGEKFAIPVTASFLSDRAEGTMTVQTLLHGWNRYGEHKEYAEDEFTIEAHPYSVYELSPVTLTAPDEDCIALFCTTLVNANGEVMNRNFVPVRVTSGDSPRRESIPDKAEIIRLAPDAFAKSEWTVKQKSILDGLKLWGTGTGFIEYKFPWPEKLSLNDVTEAEFIAELSARRIQGKDMHEKFVRQSIGDISTKGIDPGHYPNSYPMTDYTRHPSTVAVTFNGINGTTVELENDPGDHRGLLSWLNQRPDTPADHRDYNSWLYRGDKSHLHEAGSYGFLVKVRISRDAVKRAYEEGFLRVNLAVDKSSESSGGLAVYGEKFGRYPVDPTVVIRLRN